MEEGGREEMLGEAGGDGGAGDAKDGSFSKMPSSCPQKCLVSSRKVFPDYQKE